MEEGRADMHPIRVGRGARSVEAALLGELAAAAEAGRREPALLARPVRVIVPSDSLRRHLAAALMRHTGRAVAGLEIQTLHLAAYEMIERSGSAVASGDALYPILVRRFARTERALRERLDELSDAYAIVADNVTDLLDAGFTRDHEAAMIDLLEERGGARELVARHCATVRVAARTLGALSELGVGHRATLLSLARESLVRDPARVFPARRVFIHGFAEATGLRAELLEDLVRHCGAEVYLDEPPDPANPEDENVDWVFSRRLRDRLAGVAGRESLEAVPESGTLATLSAHGAEAEVRAVAERIIERIEAGDAPERIAVVARDLSGYRAALRRHFGRIGVPFSGVRERGSVGALWRATQALLELLVRGDRVPADRWIDVDRRIDGPNERSDLGLALRHVGLVRLGDVAGERRPSKDLRLPAAGGWNDGDGESEVRVERRVLRAQDFARAIAQAGRVVHRLEELKRCECLGDHLAGVRELLTDELGWDPGDSACAPVLARIDALAGDLPADFPLDADDFLALLRRALDGVGTEPIGGAGGGVAVLGVMEARARTFDTLFVLGMNRDVFPRTIRPDPLLSDPVRRALSFVLPDLPIKATGYDEERYLFAQLLSASPAVTLSWQTQDDSGRERAPSTLIGRLEWAGVDVMPTPVSPPLSGGGGGCFTAGERLTLAGLAPDAGAWAAALPVVLEDLADALPQGARGGDVALAAAARLASLEAVDPLRRRGGLCAPHFGFAGDVADADPRSGAPYVTTLESMSRCPWQTFLERVLRLAAPPDPLLALPGSDPRLLGNVVHAALDRVVRAVLPDPPRDLADLADDEATPVPWPATDALEAMLAAAAREVLDDEGITLRGLERVLIEQARPLLERARALDWAPAGGRIDVLGAEVTGTVTRNDFEGRPRELRFRADRVDVVEGARILTDYKTGKPISDGIQAKTRGKHFLTGVMQGAQLQGVAYALAAGEQGFGRYLFLKPELADDAAEFRASARQSDLVAAFDEAVGSVFAAWDRGVFFPRLFDARSGKENSACDYCEVAIACVRGDSGARLRLERGVEAIANADPESLDEPLRSLRQLWQLREREASGPPRGVDE